MALSFGDYGSSDSASRFHDKLRWAFDYALDKNVEFEQLEGVKAVAEWYKDERQYKEERQIDGDFKRTILSLIANKTTTELVKLVEPEYKAFLIDSVGLNTHFKPGVTEMNFNIEFMSLKPFVKFTKQVNGQEVASAKFRFQLDTNMYINKLQIHPSSATGGKSIDIGALGVELKLSLLDVNISSMRMPAPLMPLSEPIKLISKKFEINNLSLPIERSTSNMKENLNKKTTGAPGAPIRGT